MAVGNELSFLSDSRRAGAAGVTVGESATVDTPVAVDAGGHGVVRIRNQHSVLSLVPRLVARSGVVSFTGESAVSQLGVGVGAGRRGLGCAVRSLGERNSFAATIARGIEPVADGGTHV